jgi:hypothetical protein
MCAVQIQNQTKNGTSTTPSPPPPTTTATQQNGRKQLTSTSTTTTTTMTTDVFFSCNFGGSIISLSSPNWVPNPSIYSLFLGGAIPLPLLTPSSPKLLF